tara:strand:- start:375 stop:635 length:261 start_codon:yes stop_codon:yes gene_type:complete
MNNLNFLGTNEKLDRKILALIITVICAMFVKDIHNHIINPIVNNIIMYEDISEKSKEIRPSQIVRILLLLIIYTGMLYIIRKILFF